MAIFAMMTALHSGETKTQKNRGISVVWWGTHTFCSHSNLNRWNKGLRTKGYAAGPIG